MILTVSKIKKRINPTLTVAGILLTMCESRTTLCKVLKEEVTGSFQGQIRIFENRIPSTVKVGESIYYSMPIALYSKNASAGIAYRKFAKEHGILNPVIAQKIDGGYEMLSGHNRMNAAKLAGLKEVPAIVKTDLSEEEAYVYVIETNLMQRSFSDLLISEKAAVLKARYEKGACQRFNR